MHDACVQDRYFCSWAFVEWKCQKKILSAVNTATLYFKKKNHIYCMQFLKGWGLFLNQSSSVGALCWEASLILRLYLETKGKWKKLYNTLFSYCTLFCFSLAKLLNIQWQLQLISAYSRANQGAVSKQINSEMCTQFIVGNKASG